MTGFYLQQFFVASLGLQLHKVLPNHQLMTLMNYESHDS